MSRLVSGKPAWPEVMVGFGVLAFAALVAWGASEIPASSYAKVSPAAVPWVVVAGLVGLGCLLTLQGFAGGWPHEEGEGPIDRMGLGWLMFGLFCNVVLIDGVTFGAITLMPACGFIIASTVLFTCTARAFGSTRLLRDCCIGLLIATIAYVLFDRVLGYKIGSGFIERLL